jgi:cytochrome c oxidase subunit 2
MNRGPDPDPEHVTPRSSTVRLPAALSPLLHRVRRGGRRRSLGSSRLRSKIRIQLTVLAVALLVALVLAPEALANFITPKSGGSPNANAIASLYRITLYIAAVVFVLVEGALVYSVYKFRAKKGAVAAQIHGNTRLEIGWTVGAALILVALTVITFIKLPSIVDPPNSDASGLVLSASVTQPTPPNGKKLTVCIQGRQYIWRYTYGNGCLNNAFIDKLPYSYTSMVVPEHTTVVLDIQSSDVIHSWWIPSLGGKVDAVPGYTTYTWFKALHTGFFHGQCAQLCGTNHAAMVAYVKVVTPAQYQAWTQRQEQLITAQNSQVQQLRRILTASNNLGN